MKKKFLSIFVALTLAATMFSTTLAFAEESTMEITDLTVEVESDNKCSVWFSSNEPGEAVLTWRSNGTVLGSATEQFSVYGPFGGSCHFRNIDTADADSIALVVNNVNGVKQYEKTFPVPNLDHISNFQFKRIGQNEIEISFTSDEAGKIMLEATVEKDGQITGGRFGYSFVAGDNVVTSPLIYPAQTQDHTDDPMSCLFAFMSLQDGVSSSVWMPIAVIPAFVPLGETPDTIAPSEKESKEAVASETAETAKSLIPKSGDSNRGAAVVVLIGAVALGTVSFRVMKKAQKNAA